jgi:hypothetical protein
MTLVGKTIVNNITTYGSGDDKYIADAAYTCDGCKRMGVVTWRTAYDPTATRLQNYGRDGDPESYEHTRWFPAASHQREFPDDP